MAEMKNLAKQTAIYGVSSILGRFLNWCLAPMYTYVLANSAEYGIYTNVYAWVALLLVLLTYGMETGFFRYVNKTDQDPVNVYSSVLLCVGLSSVIFASVATALSPAVAGALNYGAHGDYVAIMCITVAIDAFCCIPMAYLRYKNRSVKFAMVNLVMIFVNIFFNVFFLIICPWLNKVAPATVSWFFDPNYSVGYIFVANLISTLSKVVMLSPELRVAHFHIDVPLLKKVLSYSLPLLILGVAGIMNQTLDKIIFPFLYVSDVHTWTDAKAQLGIYGACFKVAMVMMMFTQAFRYAYEPFVFAQNKNSSDKKQQYADAMKFFVIFSLLIFLGMVFYLDVLKHVIQRNYWEGLKVVPIILVSYVFQGIYFNLSLWYKLTDKTYFGAVFSIIGLCITVAINVAFVPVIGYWASAGASLVCFFVIMLTSYFLGQKYYPIDYDLKTIGLYFFLAMGMFAVSKFSPCEGVLKYLQNTVMFIAYLALVFKRDLPLRAIPFVGRFVRK